MTGCETTQPSNVEKPVKSAGRVKVALYDSSSRNPTRELDVYNSESQIQKPHRIIALLTCEGPAHQEGELVNAINYRARQIGANAVIVLEADRPNEKLLFSNPIFQPADSRVFRAQAVVYSDIAH